MTKLGAVPKRTRSHVAVLKGGLSAEREVSLIPARPSAKRCARKATASREIDVGRDIASQLHALKPDVVLQRAARQVRRGWLRAGHSRNSRHSLHAFRRAGFGACHAQGARQRHHEAAGVPVAEAKLVTRARGAREPCHGAALCRQAGRPKDRASASSSCRRTPTGRRTRSRPAGRPSEIVMVERYIAGPRTHLRRHRRFRHRRDRDRAAQGPRLLRLRGQIRRRRLEARAACTTFTGCLPVSPLVYVKGASGVGLPRRVAGRLPLRRHDKRNG